MRKKIKLIVTLICFTSFLSLNIFAQEHKHNSGIDVEAVDKNKDGNVFECPMDWEVLSDKKGNCDKCGMKLKEYSIKDAKKNLVKYGHEIKETHPDKLKQQNSEIEHKEMKHSESIVHKGVIDLKKIDKNKDKKVYQCPMDWNVIDDKAGRCPTCEMKLKEYSTDEAKKNLVKFGYKVK